MEDVRVELEETTEDPPLEMPFEELVDVFWDVPEFDTWLEDGDEDAAILDELLAAAFDDDEVDDACADDEDDVGCEILTVPK